MRWTFRVIAFPMVGLLATIGSQTSPVLAADPAPRPNAALAGQACSSPPGYAMLPGCPACEFPCCNNAWDGYCQEKLHWKELWCKIGTGAKHSMCSLSLRCRSCEAAPCQATTVIQPVPAPYSPAPAPAAPMPIPPAPTPAQRHVEKAATLPVIPDPSVPVTSARPMPLPPVAPMPEDLLGGSDK